ncbi:MAG: 30S ribosomal protein S17 [Planctomycetota bacterium]
MSEKIVRNKRRLVTGVVISDKPDKTIVVNVERLVRHPKYGKYVRHTTKYHAHDEKNEARAGDRVEIGETRPLSKKKCWRLVRIVRTADRTAEEPVKA